MITKKLEQIILFAGIEDYTPLWEIEWELSNKKNIHSLLLDKLYEFIKNDYIEIFFTIWGNDDNLKLIDKKDSFEVLNKKENWKPKNIGEQVIVISTTQKGEEYYELISSN